MPAVWKAELVTDGQTKCLFATSERKLKALVKEVPALECVNSLKRLQMPERLDDLCNWLNQKGI